MAKPVILPNSPDDLSRVGLLYLVRRCAPPSRYDLLCARHHELEVNSNCLFAAYTAASGEAGAALNRYHSLLHKPSSHSARGQKAMREARDAYEAAGAKRDSLLRASERADKATRAAWEAVIQPKAGA